MVDSVTGKYSVRDIFHNALSPTEVFYAAKSSGVSTEEALRRFKAAGMDDLIVHAIARIIFGRDIPNIQVS